MTTCFLHMNVVMTDQFLTAVSCQARHCSQTVLYLTSFILRSIHFDLLYSLTKYESACHAIQVNGKRFAVLTRFVDELEASLNPDEANAGERSRADGLTDQSDRDSTERSMQE